VLIIGGLLTGCGFGFQGVEIEDPSIPLARDFSIPVADSPGIMVLRNDRAAIDYSNKQFGYVTVDTFDTDGASLRALVTGPDGSLYIYDLTEKDIDILPLSKGNGVYTIGVYEHLSDADFAEVLVASIEVELDNESVPFIRPNQYVSYDDKSIVTATAAEITADVECFFKAVEAVLLYIEENIYYDIDMAESAEHGFLPDIDAVIKYGRGFCFDIAAATAAMLRSRGIPTQLVVGYYNDVDLGYMYHAWVSVYSEIDGTVGGVINLTGGSWTIIDPTFVSSMGLRTAARLTGNGTDYSAMFIY